MNSLRDGNSTFGKEEMPDDTTDLEPDSLYEMPLSTKIKLKSYTGCTIGRSICQEVYFAESFHQVSNRYFFVESKE